jgi:DNA-binding transcriptional ArsR family regulator
VLKTLLWKEEFDAAFSNENLRTDVLVAMLNGDCEKLENAFEKKIKISTELQKLCLETALTFAGKPHEALASFRSQEKSSDSTPKSIVRERLFLAGFSARRSGEEDLCQEIWSELKVRLEGSKDKNYLDRFRIEDAVLQMNRGHFKIAFEAFEKLLTERSMFDLYWQCRLLSCHSIVGDALGFYKSSERSLELEEALVIQHVSKPLATNLKRIRILNAIKRERFSAANAMLREAKEGAKVSESAVAFLLQLELDLQLARNEINEAEKKLEELQLFLSEHKLSRDIIDLFEERCNLLLRTERGVQARDEVEHALRSAQQRGNIYQEFLARTFLARIQYGERLFEEAMRTVDSAIAIGDEQGYSAELVDALFHAAGIAFGAGEHSRFRSYLARAEKLASALHLETSLRCFSYLRRMSFAQTDAGHSMIQIFEIPDLGKEVQYLLEFYQFLSEREVKISRVGKTTLAKEKDLRELIHRGDGTVFYIADASTLFAMSRNSKSKLRVDLGVGSVLAKCFELFLKSENVTLAEIHALESISAFQVYKHAPQAKSVIQRLRKRLDEVGLRIEYKGSIGSYNLPRSDIAIVTSLKRNVDRNLKRDHILITLSQEGRLTTQELCQRYDVTRQALNLHIRELVKEGLVRAIKRGPRTAYEIESRL